MILTYKVEHNRDFSEELRKAQKIVELCIKYQTQKLGPNPLPAQKTVPSGLQFPIYSPSSSLLFSFSTSFDPFYEFSTSLFVPPVLDSLSDQIRFLFLDFFRLKMSSI